MNHNTHFMQITRFPIVAIGASAGGLEAFEEFFKYMPANDGIAFVIVSHLSPNHVSMLPELIQKYTKMSVYPITDGLRIVPNTVYVMPPNKYISISYGVLHLLNREDNNLKILPIDFFLQSLASDQGQYAICIILSGMGSDGSKGLRSIMDKGGMVIAQEVASAKYESMPKSAINTGQVNYVLPLEKMPAQLLTYLNQITIGEKEISSLLQSLFRLVHAHTGYDFSLYKNKTILRRIHRRMNFFKIHSLADYVFYLQNNLSEIDLLCKEFLIGVTQFFRDPQAFEVLKNDVIPKLLANNKVSKMSLRIWIPACSTGEEVYSLAMICQECMDNIKQPLIIQLFGTDINNAALEYARAGIYPSTIGTDVNAERLKRFFIQEGECYRINKNVRETIIFAKQDLIKDPPFTKLDMVSCRNVLIYLEGAVQKKLLPLFHYSLNPGGILFLGTSETANSYTDLFSPVDKKWKIFERNDVISPLPVLLTRSPNFTKVQTEIDKSVVKENQQDIVSLLPEYVAKYLLENYGPASVVVNKKGNIVYIYGKVYQYLIQPTGNISLNIVQMASQNLKLGLETALHKAITQEKEITYSHVMVTNNGNSKYINLKIKPLAEIESLKDLLLIIFEDIGAVYRVEQPLIDTYSFEELKQYATELIQELSYTKQSLQTVIEELETSNEEINLSNEELQSANEELQSTNEEIETSKEELQSLNEELVTVNSEFQNRIEQLSYAHDDMKNLLDSTEIATIFLDNELQVKRFTPKAAEIINLISLDVGRPLYHIVSNLKYEKLIEDTANVLKSLAIKTIEVESNNQQWYQVKIAPYRTISNLVDGVVITFINISRFKQLQMEFETLKETLSKEKRK